jgi:hypothetical protein
MVESIYSKELMKLVIYYLSGLTEFLAAQSSNLIQLLLHGLEFLLMKL